MEDCKQVSTLMTMGCKLSKDDKSSPIDQIMYISMIESLLYLMDTRSNILQVICMVARFQARPKETHVTTIKRILRYLKVKMKFDLWYPCGKDFTLLRYRLDRMH